jgi:hypothetical protein
MAKVDVPSCWHKIFFLSVLTIPSAWLYGQLVINPSNHFLSWRDVFEGDITYIIIVEILNQKLMGIGRYEVSKLRFQSCENSQKLRNIFQVFFSEIFWYWRDNIKVVVCYILFPSIPRAWIYFPWAPSLEEGKSPC